jgi:tetratricopeptide (TPR) repeat protein
MKKYLIAAVTGLIAIFGFAISNKTPQIDAQAELSTSIKLEKELNKVPARISKITADDSKNENFANEELPSKKNRESSELLEIISDSNHSPDRMVNYFIENNQPEKAEIILLDLCAKHPQKVSYHEQLALLYWNSLSNPADSLVYIKRTLELDADLSGVVEIAISVYEKLGELDEGLSYLSDIAESRSQTGLLNREIGSKYAELNQMDLAVLNFEKSLFFNNDKDYYAASMLADYYFSVSDYDKAIHFYQETLSRVESSNSQNETIEIAQISTQKIMSRYAETLIKADKKSLANEILDELEKLNPENKFYKQLRAQSTL